ncbi:TerB family tellurite resistance protein [Henriciella aquimarina]|uniref:TerB family tellurite resistance protein n=1 Tax=Henriciella aquimarina TaxID=545261 RepID=UPI000A06B37D|nr:TerB family tellurite resistance protein [Henriciella aquimarina]
MHILLSLLGILLALAVWYWRIKMISGAARDGYRFAKRVSGRRAGAKAGRSFRGGLGAVNDPREAAAIMMLNIAQTRGPANDRQEAAIRAEMIDHFGFSDAEAHDLLRQARRRSGALPARTIMARMSQVITSTPGMTRKEYDDLCAMLENVAVAGGEVSEAEADLIQIWRRKAGLN